MALVTCPTGSIGTRGQRDLSEAIAAYPEPLGEGIHFCGFASEDTFGGSSYLIVRPEGNVLVDSPRFTAPLVERIEAMGGVRVMFLSHIDDVADHAKFRRHFGCERVMHGPTSRAADRLTPLAIGRSILFPPATGWSRSTGTRCLHGRPPRLVAGDRDLDRLPRCLLGPWPEQTRRWRPCRASHRVGAAGHGHSHRASSGEARASRGS
jgi:hypothetical protein